MKNLLRGLSFILTVSALAIAAPLHALAAEDVFEGYIPNFTPESQGVYLYNLDTEEYIYGKNADTPMYPASLTKIMTCIMALEKVTDLDEVITYPQYVQDYLYDYQYIQGNGAVSIGDLRAGEQLPMRDALYALMLPSANEVAMIIADHIGGSQDGFTQMMNDRARELGAVNTNFVNANGLMDQNHYTTPHDLAILTRHAMSLPGFMEIVSETSYLCPPTDYHPDGIPWVTTNFMMLPSSTDYYYAPLRGIKTGFLPEAGRCFVSTAEKDGFTYLLVVMGAPYQDAEGETLPLNMAFVETRSFYEWVFSSFKVKTLVDKGMHVGDVTLRLNMDQDRLRLMTEDKFSALLPEDVEASSVVFDVRVPEEVDAPIKKGQYIGEVGLILSGEEVGKVRLMSAESVEASQLLVFWEKGKEIMRSFWFKFAVIMLAFLIVFYIVLMILRNRNRARNRRQGGPTYKPRRRL